MPTQLNDATLAILKQIDAELIASQQEDDIVNQGVNATRLVIVLEETFGDGVQIIEDVLSLVGAEPILKSVIQNASKAIAAIRSLDSDIGSEIALEINDKAILFTQNGSFGPVSIWFVNTILIGGFTFEKVNDIIEIGQQIVQSGKLFGAKGDLASYVRALK